MGQLVRIKQRASMSAYTNTAAKKAEQFKEDVWKSVNDFQNLIGRNRVMMFSSTNCPYCKTAKQTFDSLGTSYQSYEVNKEGTQGKMMMNVVQGVTGLRQVPAIFICGQQVPGGGVGVKHLAQTGQLGDMLGRCCEGDSSCSRYEKYGLS